MTPEGAVVKHSAVIPSMHNHVGLAKPFNSEEEAIDAIYNNQIIPGDVIIIRYEGPQGTGMPEMLKTTEAIYTRPELASTTALVTDGRFLGETRGPAIGHVSPEAAVGGPISLIEEGDLIIIDIANRLLNIIGCDDAELPPEEVDFILKERKRLFIKPFCRKKSGILDLYTRNASTKNGGCML